MNTQKRWSIIFSLIFFLNIFSFSFAFPKSTQAAAVLRPIGAECDANQDAQCASGDCESSTKDGKWFCDCNTDDDCRIYGEGSWECIDGADASYDLDYCKFGAIIEPPIPAKDPSLLDTLLDTELSANEIKKMISKPVTKIKIPGVSFSEPEVTVENGVTYQHIPYLGEYIVAVYKYAVLAIGIVAVIVIIISGLIWTTSGGSADKIENAKEHINQALVGIFIAVGSYTLLFIINPELVKFKNLKVQYIQRAPFPDGDDSTSLYTSAGDPTSICNTVELCKPICENRDSWPLLTAPGIAPQKATVSLKEQHIKGVGGNTDILPNLIPPLKEAGKKAEEKGYTLFIASGYRPLVRQLAKACPGILAKNFNPRLIAWPGGSNHGSGRAVDIQLRAANGKDELSSLSSKTQNEEQYKKYNRILAEIMYEAGWQRLKSEVWHFEYPGDPLSSYRTRSCYETSC